MKVDISNLTVGNSLPISFSTDFLSPSNYNFSVDNISVNVFGDMVKQGDIFVLRAECTSVLYYDCGTCLTPVSCNISFSVDETFTSSEIDGEKDQWQFIGKIIDIKEAIYMNLIMNIPMKLVCVDDCKGLCFKCGKNLNEGDCSCDRVPKDPRFEVLYSLFNDEEEIK